MSNTTKHSYSFWGTARGALLILCSLAAGSVARKTFNVGVTS